MKAYRLYILNSLNGDIADEREFMANDDETAVWIAEGLQHSRPMELWLGGSTIQVWPPMVAAAPAPEPAQEDIMQITAHVPN